MKKHDTIDAFIDRHGEVKILQHVAAQFIDLYERGRTRSEREQDKVTSSLILIGEHIAANH